MRESRLHAVAVRKESECRSVTIRRISYMIPRATIPLMVFLMAAGAAQVAAQTGVARPDHAQVRLSTSRELKLTYTGVPEAQRMLESNTAQPVALAAADFDEDGVPDLACGYRTPNGGLGTRR